MLACLILLPALLAAAPGGCGRPRPPSATFREVAREVGIDFVHDSGAYGRKLYPERMGSGAAFFDADGDGLLDIFLVNGAPLPGHPHPRSQTSRLYINRGRGRFEDRTRGSGLEEPGYGMGVAVGDVDNDGHEDLYVTRLGRNSLYLNRGDGAFRDITGTAGVAAGGYSSSAAFVDYDGDGLLDLYVCRYIPWNSPKDDRTCLDAQGQREYCSVHIYPGMEHRLFRNLGASRFQDVTRAAGIAGHEGRGLAVVCGDCDGDGRPEILVANDETPNFLWHNNGHGAFEDRAAVAGFAYNEDGKVTAGMGLDLADVDGNGTFDAIESDFQNTRKTLYVNDGRGLFSANPGGKGLGDMPLHRLGFGIGFLDFDMDGRPDVFMANGHVNEVADSQQPGGPLAQTSQLFRNEGDGRFSDASSLLGVYAGVLAVGRGAAFGDYDNDGDTDILVVNNGAAPALLRNETPRTRHWLGVRCIGTKSSRSGLNVRVTLTVAGREYVDETRAASSYLSSSDPRVLFGLGTEARIERMDVRWPSGRMQAFRGVPVDRYVTVTEGQEALR